MVTIRDIMTLLMGLALAFFAGGCRSFVGPSGKAVSQAAVPIPRGNIEDAERPLPPPPRAASRPSGRVAAASTARSPSPIVPVSREVVIDNPTAEEPKSEEGPLGLTGDETAAGETAGEFSFRDDLRQMLPTLRDDALSIVNWKNAFILGGAAGAALALREEADGEVRRYVAERPLRWGNSSRVFRQFGEYTYQTPVLAGLYGYSLWTQDEELHNFSSALISAYSITSVTNTTIKVIADTGRPTDRFENGRFGFPSFHTASTFSMAGVIDEYYGWKAGLPAYAVATLVGLSRIDQREHDLSDVVFGSVLGLVIGKTVAAAHRDRESGVSITPWYDPASDTGGVQIDKSF
jgi:PAP2 superfamily